MKYINSLSHPEGKDIKIMKNEPKEPRSDPEKLEEKTGTPELQENTKANEKEFQPVSDIETRVLLNTFHANPDRPQAQEVWDKLKDQAERGIGEKNYKELQDSAERWKAEHDLVVPPEFQFTGEIPRESSMLTDLKKAKETLPGHKEELERLSQWYDEWNTYSQEDKLRRHTRVIQLEGRGGLQQARDHDIVALARRIEEQIDKLRRVVEIEQRHLG